MSRYYVLLSRPSKSEPWRQAIGPDGAFLRISIFAMRADALVEKSTQAAMYGISAKNLRIVTSNSAHRSCVDYVVSQLNNPIKES